MIILSPRRGGVLLLTMSGLGQSHSQVKKRLAFVVSQRPASLPETSIARPPRSEPAEYQRDPLDTHPLYTHLPVEAL